MLIKTNQQGIGLVEVMVSLILLAIATLGFVAMQGSAVKLSAESEERTHSLALMRDISERIRANPAGLDTYIDQINEPDSAAPTNNCGLYGASTAACNADELAAAQSHIMNQHISESDFKIRIVTCPEDATSQCLISAWGDTNATIGDDDDDSDGSMDCLTEEQRSDDGNVTTASGQYHRRATCMTMRIN